MTIPSRQPRPNADAIPVTRTARFIVRGRERGASASESVEQAVPPSRVPRVARLMALAIRFDSLIGTGAVSTQAELAELGRVTRARVTQIMNLLHLAPDIQEAVLHLPMVANGRDPITEHELRAVTSLVGWSAQRQAWLTLSRRTT